MPNVRREFVSNENRQFTVKIGKAMATALSGFVAGTVVASIVWVFVLVYAYMD
jgi:hypothetical protein